MTFEWNKIFWLVAGGIALLYTLLAINNWLNSV